MVCQVWPEAIPVFNEVLRTHKLSELLITWLRLGCRRMPNPSWTGQLTDERAVTFGLQKVLERPAKELPL